MTSTWLSVILMMIGTALAIIAVHDLVRRRRDRGERAFHLLCAAAGLSRADRRLLRQVARAAELPNPACLLLSRACFDQAMRAATEAGIPRASIDALRRRINEPPQRAVPGPMMGWTSKA